MPLEEKAKRYDEALERARAFNNGEDVDVEAGTTFCEYIFPELKESEDERIRRIVYGWINTQPSSFFDLNRISKEDMLAWLEKQGEQKPQGKSALEAINEELNLV